MTHFEYISVGAALIFALVIGRLVAGLPAALDRERSYWVHVGWIFVMILVTVFQWWGIWRVRQLDWTPFLFLWLLLMPGIMLARSIVLVGTNPETIQSFREHFFEIRVRFFSLGLASGLHLVFTPWVGGLVPWLSIAPAHRQALLVSTISILGICVRQEGVHKVLVFASLASVVVGFILVPIVG